MPLILGPSEAGGDSRPGYAEKAKWNRQCTYSLVTYAKMQNVTNARKEFQEELDQFVAEAATSPGLLQELFGRSAKPAPERRPSEQFQEDFDRNLADAGRQTTDEVAARRAARIEAENDQLRRDILAAEEPELPDSGLIYDLQPTASMPASVP
jgi:hypothetical protein